MLRWRFASRQATVLALLLTFVGLVDLLCMPSTFWVGDPIAWREESRAIARGQLAVDPRFGAAFGEPGQYFVARSGTTEPRWYSKYGLANSVMSLPPTMVDRWVSGRNRRPGEAPDLLIFNLYQIGLALLVGIALFRLAGRYSNRLASRVIYVVAVLYGTFLWYFQRAQSSEIYQVLFYTVWFEAFVRYLSSLASSRELEARKSRSSLAVAWCLTGCLVFTRVVYGLLIPVMLVAAAVVMLRRPRAERVPLVTTEAPLLMLPPVLIVLVLGLVNWIKFGSPLLTGYHVWQPEVHWLTFGYWGGLSGFIIDPQGSVFLYFPTLLFALLGLRRFRSTHPVDTALMWWAFIVFFLFLGKTPSWLGGWTYGPRYLLFALPVLALPFISWLDSLLDQPLSARRAAALAFAAVTLGLSAYLTERQNRLDFFVHERVSEELAPYATPATERYFHGHHVGWISADLIAHSHRVDDLAFMSGLHERMPIDELTGFRRRLKAWSSSENYYWRRRDRQLQFKR